MAKEDLHNGILGILGGITFFAMILVVYIKTGESPIEGINILLMVIGGLLILLGLYKLYEYYQDSTD